MIKNAPCLSQFGVLFALCAVAAGCKERGFNKSSTQSNEGAAPTSSDSTKTFSCNVGAPIIPGAGKPNSGGNFGEFKMSIDTSAMPFQVRIEKNGSFKQWVEAAVGQANISDFTSSETLASLQEVEIQLFGRSYRYKITLDAGSSGEVIFYLPISSKIKDSNVFTESQFILDSKDYGVKPDPKAMDGLLGKCKDGSVKDDGVRGILNNAAINIDKF